MSRSASAGGTCRRKRHACRSNGPLPRRGIVDAAANLRLYYPDFVARLQNGEHWLLETKGQENVDVTRKDRGAALWCENATALTGTTWRYLKVPQNAFNQLQPADVADLAVLGDR